MTSSSSARKGSTSWFKELGYEQAYSLDLVRLNVSIKPAQSPAKRFPLVVLHQTGPSESRGLAPRAYILFDIQPAKRADDRPPNMQSEPTAPIA